MDTPTDTVSLQIKSELQYDVDAEHPAFPSGSLSAITMTVSETTNLLNVYYISNNSIFSAYQQDKVTAGSPLWKIDDTQFPLNVVPKLIRAITRPESSDIIIASTNDNKLYLLDLATRFPQWKKLIDPPSGPIADVQLFLSSTNKLLIAIQSGNFIYIGQQNKLVDDGWVKDLATQTAFIPHGGIASFKVSPDLGAGSNGTSYGYLVACNNGGLYTLTGTPYAAIDDSGDDNIQFVLTTIDPTGKYNSAWAASVPGRGSSLPVVFAGDNTLNVYYFQPQLDGTFTKVQLYTDTKVQALEPIIRTRLILGTSYVQLYAELFGLHPNGGIYHLQSGYDAITDTNSFTQLSNGNYSVQNWSNTVSQVSDKAAAICSQPGASADGSAFILQYSDSGGPSLTFLHQDPETSDWSTESVVLPGGGHDVPPNISQFPVYYVEATVYNENMAPTPGWAVVITATQDATININGKTVQVNVNRSFTALSNAAGRISFSQATNDSIAIPTFSLWAEGMTTMHVMDVKPNGEIQSRLSSLTIAELRSAKNMDSPDNPPLFPPDKVDDATLQAAADGAKEIFSVFNPPPPTNSETDAYQGHPFRYIHPGTRPSLARTRHRNGRSMAHVIGRAEYGVTIQLLPYLKVTKFPRGKAPIEDPTIFGLDISWGDLWHGIKQGFYTLKQYTLDPVVNAIKASITVLKDGVASIWNGAVNFVQKAFDFVSGIFNQIGAAFKELFGWLAFLLNWGDIKHTAQQFQTALQQFPAFGKQLFGSVLPGITKGGFAQAKTWLNTNMATAQTRLGDMKVGDFDDTSKIPHAGALIKRDAADGGSVLDSLPSTANWLMNKLFNGGSGSAGDMLFSSDTSVFDRLSSTFVQNLEDIGAKQDFYTAFQDFGKMLMTFKNRGVMDGTSWASLLVVVKDILLLLLDIAEMAALTMESVFAEAMNFVMDIMNAPLNIPIISWVFEKVCGVELTIINSISFIVAIPYTILYKLITGNKPPSTFETGPNEINSPSNPLNIAKGVIMVLQSTWSSIITALTTEMETIDKKGKFLRWPSFIARVINGINICVPIIVFGLGGYPALENPTMGSVLGWSAGLISPGLLVYHMVSTRGASTTPPGTALGDVVQTIIGVGMVGYAIYATVEVDNWDAPTKALIVSKWFAPWSMAFRWLHTVAVNMDPGNAQYVIAAELIIDLVSGIGSAVAFIVASSTSDDEEEGEEGEKTHKRLHRHHAPRAILSS